MADREAPDTRPGPSTWQADRGVPLAEGPHESAAWTRRAAMTGLAVIAGLALASDLGVRTESRTASAAGWRLTLRYPAVARAGLDVVWQATVDRPGGFAKELTLAVTGDYLDIYETQGFHPSPSDETRDGHNLYLTFAAPQGDRFVLDFDTYVQPAAQRGRSGTVAVVDNTTFATFVSLPFETRLVP